MSAETLNLKQVRTLVADSDSFGGGMTVQMLRGLGMENITLAATSEEARKALEKSDFDLCICDARLSDMPGVDFVRWLRRLPSKAKFLPTIAMTGYSYFNAVAAFRDAGAHLVMKKPASPQALWDRIAWISKPPREFIECESYIGPDRRFKCIGPPGGVPRRSTDLSITLGAASEPNMSQDEIDSLMRPTRILAE